MRLLCVFVFIALCVYMVRSSCPNHCEVQESRKSRSIIAQRIVPELRRRKIEFPETCPFTQGNDCFFSHESSKSRFMNSKWNCKVCNERFSTEHDVDTHLMYKHGSRYLSDAEICLGDFLHILTGEIKCNDPSNMILAKQQCDYIGRLCFTGDSSEYEEVRRYFLTEFCYNLHCTEVQHDFSEVIEERRRPYLKLVSIIIFVMVLLLTSFGFLIVFIYRSQFMSSDDLRYDFTLLSVKRYFRRIWKPKKL